ncbi:MAG: hypothetical protein RLZZ403_1276 [Pseudomonadota bacterium]
MVWVRCERCGRARDGLDSEWSARPVQPGEVLGYCKTCGDVLGLLQLRRQVREGRKLLRDRERGYGPAAPGTDVFAGMGGEMGVSERAITIVESDMNAPLTMDNAPATVLAEAQKAAAALHDVIKRKPKPVQIGGETYLEYEDWQTIGRFYGYTAGIEHEPEFIELGGAKGFKATAIAIDKMGVIRSRATAYCMDDEDRWQKAPTYQIASMAQTRANAKVLRNVLSWVAVLAGYKPTPAEEMDGVSRAATAQRPQSSLGLVCPKCGKAESVMISKFPKSGKTHFCNPKGKVPGCGAQFEPPSHPPGSQGPEGPDDEPPPYDGE